MFSDVKKQHLIVFLVMLVLLFGGGVAYGKYLEKKALPPISVLAPGDVLGQGEENSADINGHGETNKAPMDLMVHVTGAVERPGVYTLPEGSRVIDVIELARPQGDADLNRINLAKKISDQEMIIIPAVGEEISPALSGGVSSGTATVVGSISAGGSGGALININLASQAELESLPGIGPAKAQAIMQYREEKGPFSCIEDICQVSGIGPATFEKLKSSITV